MCACLFDIQISMTRKRYTRRRPLNAREITYVGSFEVTLANCVSLQITTMYNLNCVPAYLTPT
jgi:hypothetical protein